MYAKLANIFTVMHAQPHSKLKTHFVLWLRTYGTYIYMYMITMLSILVTNKMKENSFGEEMLNAAEKGLAQPELFDETHQPPDEITAKIQRDIVHMTQYRPHNRIDITDVLTHLKSYGKQF